MPVYIYEAMDTTGKKIKGELFGESQSEVISWLKNGNLYPVDIEVKKITAHDTRPGGAFFLKRRIKKKQVAVFARQFSSMLQAGVPLAILLDVLIKQQKNSAFREILIKISQDVLTGNTLSSSLAKFDVFPDFFVSMAAVGEENGRLGEAIDHVATNMEKELKLAAKVKGAMTYPLILLVISIISCIVLAFVVIPAFAGMFGEMGAELPASTRFFINLSRFIYEYWYVAASIIAVMVIVFLKAFKEPEIRERMDKLLFSLPLIGRIQNGIFMARFSRIISSLIESGIDVVRSLEVMRNITKNQYLKSILAQIVMLVQSGTTLSAAASRFRIFQPLVISMVKVGEESGNLESVLLKTAELYENESEEQLQRFTALVEPAMTLIMAAAIGFIVLSIVQPMFQMYSGFGR